MKSRACIFALSLSLALPGSFVAQKKESNPDPKPQEIATMPNMRSLVPSLVALGWDDFFLGMVHEIGLSPEQVRKLYFLGTEFLAATRELQGRVEKAELDLHDILDRDQVTMRDIEAQARWVGALRGELTVLHYQYLLQAINVLNHEQHLQLVASLKLRWMPLQPQGSKKSSPPEVQSALYRQPSLRTIQYREDPEEIRRREEALRCGTQASVSVQALLGYERGRKAAERLAKLAETVGKVSESGSHTNLQKARKLVAEMQPELWLVEWTGRALLSLVSQNPAEQSGELADRLQTQALAGMLTEMTEEVHQAVPNLEALKKDAKQLKGLAKQWSQSVRQASKTLCLQPSSPSIRASEAPGSN